MKKFLLASAALFAMCAPTLAADMARPVYKAPPPVVAPWSWTGIYLGLNAGGAWGRSDTLFTPTGLLLNFPAFVADATVHGSPRQNPSGFTGGVQVGFNWQTGVWVLGAEADFQYLGLKAETTTPTFVIPPIDPYRFTTTTRTDWLATVRPRLGVAFDRLLVFATGGLAVGNRKFSSTLTFDCPCLLPDANTGSVSTTAVGWTAGGGFEYLVASNWTIRAEYLYVDLGEVNFASSNNLNPIVTANHSETLKVHIARAAFNYKFDWGPAPVIARY